MSDISVIGTEYDTVLDETAIKIGGTGEKFVPNINASKWDNEAWLNINTPEVVLNEKETFKDGVIEITIGDRVHRYYEKEGKLEYEIEFRSNPLSNIVTFNLLFPPGLVFYYQPELEQWEIDEGCVRPDDVVGSYAVYWAKRNNKYKTGKFCHIYRPKLIDANRKEAWCELKYDSNRLIITMPRLFLNTARYPVILDPELGYSTAGDSNAGNDGVFQSSHDVTDASGGNIDTFHCALDAVDGTNDNYKMGVYPAGADGDPSDGVLVEQVEFTSVAAIDDNNTPGAGSLLAASTRYAIAKIEEDSDTKTKYDSGAAESHWADSGANYADMMPNPADGSHSDGTRMWSIWIDYSAAGAPSGVVQHSSGYTMRRKKEIDGEHIPGMI